MQHLSGKKILVTGADGFIGSHLVETLVRNGASVRALVFYNSLNSWGWLDDAAPDTTRDTLQSRDAKRMLSVPDTLVSINAAADK
jgi:nucleoside-diphosphate-sugar epimerase